MELVIRYSHKAISQSNHDECITLCLTSNTAKTLIKTSFVVQKTILDLQRWRIGSQKRILKFVSNEISEFNWILPSQCFIISDRVFKVIQTGRIILTSVSSTVETSNKRVNLGQLVEIYSQSHSFRRRTELLSLSSISWSMGSTRSILTAHLQSPIR